MKYITIVFLLFISFAFCESPYGFNNQRTVISYIEENINDLSNIMKSASENPLNSVEDKNNFIVSINQKEFLSDKIANLLCREFLQKYISPSDDNVQAKITSIHKMLNLCSLIKNSMDINNIKSLKKEMGDFKKLMRYNFKIDSKYSKKTPKK